MVKTINVVALILIALPCLSAIAQTGGSSSTGTFTDKRDNKTYRTVRIGNLTWMAENLNFRTDSSSRYAYSSPCYEDDSSNCTKYGRLYKWEAAKKACEGIGGGWRLPMNEDWDNLVNYAGDSSVAGKTLKSKTGWNDRGEGINGNGADDYGFSALPGGIRFSSNGRFFDVGHSGSWWSASEYGRGFAYHRSMEYDDFSAYQFYSDGEAGYSVRCVTGSARLP
jgi:uncharacterized protein (TIGR02145 family)